MRFAAEIPAYFPDGFFWAKMILSDVFLLEDRLVFSKHGPYHRTKITNRESYLTIPCHYSHPSQICNVQIDNTNDWMKKHWATISTNYRDLPYSDYLLEELQPLFNTPFISLSSFLSHIIRYMKYIWRISTPIFIASEKLGCKLPEYYVNEWHQVFSFDDLLVFEKEIPFLKKKNIGKIAFKWNLLKITEDHFLNDLNKNSLYLLFKYGTEFPGLVKKWIRVEGD